MKFILTKHGHHLSQVYISFAPATFILVRVFIFGEIKLWICAKGI